MDELRDFGEYLREREKSAATIEKYLRDARGFLDWLDERELTKEEVLCYKEQLRGEYRVTSINAKLAGINSYLGFIGRADCRVKPLRVQRSLFSDESRELTQEEYIRLLRAAGKRKIFYIMQVICGTGIRVSELRYITAEAVREGRAAVWNKGKVRVIFIPEALRKLLLSYMKKHGISSGSIFLTKHKKPFDRNAVWREMKSLCEKAQVDEQKVFPHALRHLFARVFYSVEKDLLRLADILGHASINTTRIYTMESGKQHIKILEEVNQKLRATEC